MDLRTQQYKVARGKLNFPPGALFSLYYHNIFRYPLKKEELEKWTAGKTLWGDLEGAVITTKDGYFFLDARTELIAQRRIREKISQEKRVIAGKAARLLAKIPSVRMVGITGSLAMGAADVHDDIDLMVITAPGTLWSTRALAYLLLNLNRFPVRRFGEKETKDKLCLNIWLDTDNLAWEKTKRNVYSAHEIAQIIPLVNKTGTHERFLAANAWHKKFWPNAVKISRKQKFKYSNLDIVCNWIFNGLEFLAYGLQYFYMRKKITKEKVSRHKALFHPHDWSNAVAKFLKVDTL